MQLERVLYEEAGAVDAGGAGPAPVVAVEPAASFDRRPGNMGPSVDSVLSKVEAMRAAERTVAPGVVARTKPEAVAAPVVAAEPEAPKLKPLPAPEAPKIKGARDRILARRAEEEASSKSADLQSKYETQLQAEREARTVAEKRTAKLALLQTEKDIDSLAEELGFKGGFEEMQRTWLEKRMPKTQEDPRVTELQAKLSKFEQEAAEKTRKAEEQQRQRELAELIDSDRKAVAESMRHSGYERLDKLAEKPFAVQLAYQSMAAEPHLDDVEHFRRVDSTYERLFRELEPIYGKGGTAAPQAAAAKPKTAPAAAPAQAETPALQAPPAPRSMPYDPTKRPSQKDLDQDRMAFLEKMRQDMNL
jgi:hypothetical protein